MSNVVNALNWFEIPVTDMARAKKFYSEVLQVSLTDLTMGDTHMAMFATEGDGVGGALCQGPTYEPSDKGSLVYLNAQPDLSAPLGRVAAAGGKVLLEKMSIGENGFIAYIADTEGNKVAFHSMQ